MVGTDDFKLVTKGELKHTHDKISEFISSSEHIFCRMANNLKMISAMNKMLKSQNERYSCITYTADKYLTKEPQHLAAVNIPTHVVQRRDTISKQKKDANGNKIKDEFEQVPNPDYVKGETLGCIGGFLHGVH